MKLITTRESVLHRQQWHTYVTDEERVAEAMGHRDRDGVHGKISKQFTATLKSHGITLDEIFKFDKESFLMVVSEVAHSVDTYGILKACVCASLLQLRNGTQNRNNQGEC